MIEINLLPEELRPRRSRDFVRDVVAIFGHPQLSPRTVLTWAAIAVIALQVMVSVIHIAERVRLASLNSRYARLGSKRGDVEKIKAEINAMNKKTAPMDEIMTLGIRWAELLNSLSDSVTPGVWLAKLSYEETPQEVSARSASAKSGATAGQKTAPPARQKTAKFLKLAGYAYSSSEDLTACVGRFIKSLKANRAFYDDFKNIAVEDLKEDRFESQEVMYFKIVCAFKDRD